MTVLLVVVGAFFGRSAQHRFDARNSRQGLTLRGVVPIRDENDISDSRRDFHKMYKRDFSK